MSRASREKKRRRALGKAETPSAQPNGPQCPACNSRNTSRRKSDGLWFCHRCGGMFDPTDSSGPLFDDPVRAAIANEEH